MIEFLDGVVRYWPILALIGLALWGLAMMRAGRSFAEKTVVEQQGREIAALKEEQIKQGERLQSLPSIEDFHSVSIKLTEVHGGQNTQRAEIEGMRQSLTTIDRSVNRIETYLLKKSEGR